MARPNRDAQHLSALQDYYAKHHFIPSYARLGVVLGIRAKSAIAVLLGRLIKAGYLTQSPDKRMLPTKKFFQLPFSESPVAAGLPVAATPDVRDMVSLDEQLVRRPSATFFVPIKGDSMIEAGLLPGDTVIVERRNTASEGDIVVAVVNNEFTIKTLAREKNRYVLKPQNAAYPVLRPEVLEIAGVVTGSFRSYRRR